MNQTPVICMKSDPILTIAIPTFNRAAKLQRQLELLIPQLTPEVRLSIYDNASTDGTGEVVAKFNHPNLFYSCSHSNTGGGHNFLRCFDQCQTEWLWMLSDDDPVTPTAITDLIRLVKDCKSDFIHTSAPNWCHHTDRTLQDLSELLFPDVGSLIWISAGLYRIPVFRSLLWHFNASMSTTIPHLVMVLALLENKTGTVLFTRTNVLTEAPEASPRWSTLDFITRLSQVPEYLQNPDNQALTAQCIYNHLYYWALLMGIREVHDRASIQRWQRVRKLAKFTLRAYGAKSPVYDLMFPNPCEVARRRTKRRSKKIRQVVFTIYYNIMIRILSWSPAFLFLSVFKWMPKTQSGWDWMFPKNSKESLDTQC